MGSTPTLEEIPFPASPPPVRDENIPPPPPPTPVMAPTLTTVVPVIPPPPPPPQMTPPPPPPPHIMPPPPSQQMMLPAPTPPPPPPPLKYWRDEDILDFLNGRLVAYPPTEKSTRNVGHLLRLQSLADEAPTAQETLTSCVEAVREWVTNARCRADALMIMESIADAGAHMSNRWLDIVLYNIKISPASTRGNKKAPDSRARLHRANEIFLRDYLTKLTRFGQRVAGQQHISLNDVLTALTLLGRIAHIPSM